jgi:hypothetical protein
MLLYKIVIRQVRIGSVNPVYLFSLSRRKFLIGIETPAAFEKALAS